jgi:hypothetical protein
MTPIIAAISRVLNRDEYREPRVHFHASDHEQPEVCYEVDCMRPRVRVD